MAAVLLSFLGIGGVIFGFLSFGAMLRRPFDLQIAEARKNSPALAASQSPNIEALKRMDTDGDGLSDYDEIYIYHTSPYLKDTNGDGIDDKTEILIGKDPNCPPGKICSGGSAIPAEPAAGGPTTSMAPATAVDGTSPPATGQTAGSSSLAGGGSAMPPTDTGSAASAPASGSGAPVSPADAGAYLKSLSPDQARQLLQQAGVPADQLSSLSDAQVTQLLGQLVDQAQGQGLLNQSTSAASSSTTP